MIYQMMLFMVLFWVLIMLTMVLTNKTVKENTTNIVNKVKESYNAHNDDVGVEYITEEQEIDIQEDAKNEYYKQRY